MTLCKALSKFKSNSKLLFSLSGSRSSSRDNGKAKAMVAEGSRVAKQTVGSVGGGQLDGGQLDGLSSGGDGRGSQEAAVQAVAVDGGGVDVVDGPGDQGVVAVLGLLQLDELGVSGSVGLNWLKGSSLVLDGLLGHSGHSVHCTKAWNWGKLYFFAFPVLLWCFAATRQFGGCENY